MITRNLCRNRLLAVLALSASLLGYGSPTTLAAVSGAGRTAAGQAPARASGSDGYPRPAGPSPGIPAAGMQLPALGHARSKAASRRGELSLRHMDVSALGDMTGRKKLPDGKASTGLSRSVPRTARSALGFLALVAAGLLLLTVAGIARLRQVRWARRAAAHVR